jgi:hypothetical protein
MADIDIDEPVSSTVAPKKGVIEVWPSGLGWTARARGSLPAFTSLRRQGAIRLASPEVIVGDEPLGQRALYDERWARQFYVVEQISPPPRRR